MKTRLLTALCATAVLFATTRPAAASYDDLAMATDALVGRPACFVATVVGSALFVISLPFAAMSHSVDRSAHMFVVVPARATFTRPLGDMEALMDE
jgi:hypothetical protein